MVATGGEEEETLKGAHNTFAGDIEDEKDETSVDAEENQ